MKRTYLSLVAALALTPVVQGAPLLKITEIYEGVSGEDVTEDWFELTNFGSSTFTLGVDGDIYYDDESQDPTKNALVSGITDIAPGESVIVVLDLDPAQAAVFVDSWGAANLAGVEVGYLSGDGAPGLSSNGDAVFLFESNQAGANLIDSAAYAGGDNSVSGATWTYNLVTGEFDGLLQSIDGVDGAFTAPVAAGDFGEFPLVGSPGIVPEPASAALLALGGLALATRRRA